jgi:nucleotide-binding universal stress UspA family protein
MRAGAPAHTEERHVQPVPQPVAVNGPPVVVGVDGSPDATRAVVWAAEEAARRRRPLRLLSALPAHGVHSAFLVADAAEEAQRVVPGVAVSTAVVDSAPVAALLEAARDAGLLVVGSRGLGPLRGLLLGSVSAAVIENSACPTVVVRGSRIPTASDPVVVGVDGTPATDAAVGFAFATADREGVPLVAVHVRRDVLEDPEWWSMREDDGDVPQAELLAERLAGWCSEYPDAEVVRHLPVGHPIRALVDMSSRARLLVVGSHRRRGLDRLGSVGRAVLYRAHCPVAVVPVAGPPR